MDFKDRMIEAIERGWTTEREAYDYVRESMAHGADLKRKRDKENPQGSKELGGSASPQGERNDS